MEPASTLTKAGKAKATKTPRATSDIPSFPFVGAGDARYFEWAEMFVRFRREPKPAQRAAIAAAVPAPLRDTIKWNGPFLWVASEQGVGRAIKAAYGGKKPKEPKELSQRNRFAQASSTADGRFNAQIEDWLAASHAIAPILVAYRRQDAEAGGTKLSDWHRASIARAPAILAAIADAPVARDALVVERLAKWAASEGVAVDAKLVKNIVTRCKPLLARLEEQERAAERAAQEKRIAEALAPAAKGGAARKGKAPRAMDAAALRRVLAALDRTLPAFVEALRKLPPKDVQLRPGATPAAIAATEAAVKQKLSPAHKALLAAFDGGRVGKLVFAGTEAGGARGDESIEALAKALKWYVPIVHTDRDHLVVAKKNSDAALWLSGTIAGDAYDVVKTARTLDRVLADVVKAGSCKPKGK